MAIATAGRDAEGQRGQINPSQPLYP